MKTYLFIYSIGPVQSFIAAARKTEDYWSGSYLLSYLTERTIEQVLQKNQYNVKVLSPSITLEEIQKSKANPSQVASLPNRFLVRLEAESDESVRLFGKEIEETTKLSFITLGEKAFHKVFPNLKNNEYIKQLIKTQLTNLLEIYWAFEEWDNSTPEKYNDVRNLVERRLASVKNNRSFKEISQEGLVCTVCGTREALHEGNINENHTIGQMHRIIKQTWRKRSRKYQETDEDKGARIKDNERLCAVCLTKRLTREIIFDYNSNAIRLFEPFPSVKEFVTENNPYYAIFMMDGDDIGKWLNGSDGKLLSEFPEVNEAYHQEFSRRLTIFSKDKVPNIVEKQLNNQTKNVGKLIYSGGDDVLAFISLSHLLPVIKELREAFSASDVLGNKATASMGIVIAHYKEPLQKVIRTAQQMEAVAKQYHNNYQEKDAVSISLISNSGQTRFVTIPWYLDAEKSHSVIDVLTYLNKAFGTDLSSTFLYHFNEAFAPLIHGGKKPNVSLEIIESELRRLIKRSAKNKNITEKLIKNLILIYNLTETFTEYIHLLETIRFIAGKINVASTLQAREGVD